MTSYSLGDWDSLTNIHSRFFSLFIFVSAQLNNFIHNKLLSSSDPIGQD